MRVQSALLAPPPIRPTSPIGLGAALDAIARVGEGEGDAFHRRAHEIDAAGRIGQAEEDAARMRIIVRRALAGEVGQE